MNYNGKIELILGPMYSGKSTELLRRLNRENIAKKKCLAINLNLKEKLNFDNIITNTLDEENIEFSKYDIIGIDQGHLINNIDIISDNLANNGKKIIISALDSDYNKNPFDNISNLVPKSEDIIKLNAICLDCKKNSSFNKKVFINNEYQYVSLCRNCYHK